MIDLHTHILPGIDDGSADFYDTLEMARIAVDSNVTAMVATPHCNIPGMFQNYYGREYIQLFQKTEAMLEKEKIPLTLYTGMEVFVTTDLLELLRAGKILTINGSRYILAEFGFREDPYFVERMLYKLMESGLHPVIAHPERYEFVQDDPQLVYEWRQKGYHIQVNKGSFQRRFGRRAEETAYALLNHNLITVIASDTHGPCQRTPYLMDVYEELSRMYSNKYMDILFQENPRRIIQDKPLIRVKERPFAEEEWQMR